VGKGFESKLRYMKWVYRVSAPCCLFLGLWIVIAPTHFWGLLRVNDTDPIVQTIYGAVLCGIGILCALGIRRPLRYMGALQIMMAYKSVMCLALIPRLALMDGAPLAGWLIVFFWACVAIVSALVYPWGRHAEIVEIMRNE
jgi:hypothetical protein